MSLVRQNKTKKRARLSKIIKPFLSIEEILFALTSKGVSIIEWREMCRQIGARYFEVNFYCGADAWKRVRDALVTSLSQYSGNRCVYLFKAFISAV